MMLTSGCKGEAAVTAVQRFLRRWDRGGPAARKRMLAAFVGENEGATGAELEQRFAHMASLLLTRITAWLRLHYTCQTCLASQLKAISVFLAAPGTLCYLKELFEVGGVFTLLEVARRKRTSEENRAATLRLLQVVASAGQTFKELVCQSSGLPVVAGCLSESTAGETQVAAVSLLELLAHGNPKYRQEVYMVLISLISRTDPPILPQAQRLLLPTLRTVQKSLTSVHPSILEPSLDLLKSSSPEVQYEALELIRALKDYEVATELLKGLVALLKPAEEAIQENDGLEDPKNGRKFPVFVQQAAAAKAVRMFAQESQEVSDKLLRHRVVHHLLYAMGTRGHADVQQQASLALQQFVRTCPVVEEHVREAMGSTLFNLFMHNAEVLHLKMDEVQLDKLLSNKVNISAGLKDPPN